MTWDKAHAAVGAMIGAALTVLVVMLLTGCGRHVNPCTANRGECYSIQGVYSQLGCPGQHIETVDVDGQSFFLGCY